MFNKARERIIQVNVQQEPEGESHTSKCSTRARERESHTSKYSTRARERIIQVNVQQEPERESYK